MSEQGGKDTNKTANEAGLQMPGQLEVGLKWLSEHAPPLTAIILAISLWHLHNYLEVEGVPVSIASSALLATLPAVFAKTALIVGAMSLSFLLPTLLLLTRVKERGTSLIEAMLGDRPSKEIIAGDDRSLTDQPQCRISSDAGRGIAVRWAIGFIFYGLLLGGVSFIVSTDLVNNYPWWSTLVGLIALAISIIAFLRIVTKIPLSRQAWERQTSPDFRMICVATAFAQFVLMTSLVDVTAQIASQYTGSTFRFLLVLAVVLAGLGAVQILGAIAVHKVRTHRKPSVVALQASIVLVALSAVAVKPSAMVVGSMLQVKAPDGKDCVLLVSKSISPSFGAAGAAEKDTFPSLEVRILLEADGTYYVRPFDTQDRDVSLIPKDEIGKLSACPAKPNT